MDFLFYLIPPVAGAFIGYSTNWLAIKMLFRPHRAVCIFGFQLPFTPGLIPKGREKLARKVAAPDVLARELTSLAKTAGTPADNAFAVQLPRFVEWLKNGLDDNPAMEEWLVGMVKKIIQEHVGRFAGLFLDAEKIYASIKEGLFEYLSAPGNQALLLAKAEGEMGSPGLGRVLGNIVTHIAHRIPIQEMIENKLNAFAVDEAEKLILSVISRELNMIMALGGVLGFLIGLMSLLLP
jgi:uncharacterized membrane protein YheB (UPF0754 family)